MTGGSGAMPPYGDNFQVQVGDLWVRCEHLEAVLVSDGARWRGDTVSW